MIILSLLAIALLFLSGIFLSYFFFPICNIIERAAYSIIFSICSTTIAGYLLTFLSIKDPILPVILVIIASAGLLIYKAHKAPDLKKTFKTSYNKDILFIALFSLIGAVWRYLFLKSTNNFGDAYVYAGRFENGATPDLGFYTGMVKDHSNYYTAGSILNNFFTYFQTNWLFFGILIITFLYLSFIYFLFTNYTENRKLTFAGLALMSLGPIEIFYTTISYYGHAFSYITLFSLFLFFKSKNNIFWPTAFLAAYSTLTYYTGTIIVILASSLFLFALTIKEYLDRRSLKGIFSRLAKNKKAIGFFIIFILSITYLLLFSNMQNFSTSFISNSQEPRQPLKFIIEKITNSGNMYSDPGFLGLSSMRWQILFFLLCGITFIFYLMLKRSVSEKDIDILLCFIPVVIISFCFFYANIPTRIFSYFAFFGLMILKIPNRYYKIFLVASLIFITATSIFIAKDKKIFFEAPQGEIAGAKTISESLDGKIFSDEVFVNQLVLSGFYNVTGADDADQMVENLFYQNNKRIFLNSIDYLEKSGVDYIVITKRMIEKYVLMVNYPQRAIINYDLYENNLKNVYSNGYINVYSTDITQT